MRAMKVSNPTVRAIADQMEQDEVIRWSASLPRARVTRWGGMISTPDSLLQVKFYFRFQSLDFNIAIQKSCCPKYPFCQSYPPQK